MLEVIGSALPLKHFAEAMAETFDSSGGSGFVPVHLAVMAAWAAAGAVVALLRFQWRPRGPVSARETAAGSPARARLSAPREFRPGAPTRPAAPCALQ